MKTDWKLIRLMMDTAIDTCEQLEALGYNETHRDLVLDSVHGKATVFDFMVSAVTYPENLRYQIIRERHVAGADLPYVHEFSRILVAMAHASAELVGGKDSAPAESSLQHMVSWYRDHAMPNLARALAQREG